MIKRKLATDQILRLSSLSGWERLERIAKTELTDALIAVARNDYHASRTISDVIAAAQWVPTPADIRVAAGNARTTPEPPGSGGCDRCSHTGRISNWYLWSIERHPSGDLKRHTAELIPSNGTACWLMYPPNIPLGKDQELRVCSEFCGCSLGQRLKAGKLNGYK
jgi:hypothetical protein